MNSLIIIKYAKFGNNWLAKHREWGNEDEKDDTSTQDIDTLAIPASDRSVSRNDNQEVWGESIEALDSVIAEFKKDHPRDNEVGSEKPALLGALKAGRRLLDDTRINVQIGVALLIEPLKVIVARYNKEVVGALANTALQAIARLLGIL